MNEITSKPIQMQGIISQDVDGETLLLNNQGAEIHQLNDVASLIWKCCDGSHSVDEISQMVIDQYAAPPEQVMDDVSKILTVFKEKNLIK